MYTGTENIPRPPALNCIGAPHGCRHLASLRPLTTPDYPLDTGPKFPSYKDDCELQIPGL